MRMFLHQLRAEQLVFWRNRESAVFVFIFPVMLFLLLSAVFSGEYRGRDVAEYLTYAIVAYGVAATTFAGLAISLVVRREAGILKRLRATPLPAPLYLVSAVVSLLVVFALQSVVIVAIGRLAYDARLPDDLLSLVLTYAYSALCFAGIGVGIAGLIRSAEGAAAVVNVIALPMTFLAGGFGPTRNYPDFLQALADALPLTYVVELTVGVLYEGKAFWEQPGAIAVLALWGAVGVAVAVRTFGWEPRER